FAGDVLGQALFGRRLVPFTASGADENRAVTNDPIAVAWMEIKARSFATLWHGLAASRKLCNLALFRPKLRKYHKLANGVKSCRFPGQDTACEMRAIGETLFLRRERSGHRPAARAAGRVGEQPLRRHAWAARP